MRSLVRIAAIAALLPIGACLAFRPMTETLRERPISPASISQLGAAQFDVEASSLSLDARPNLDLRANILRLEIADALNAELGDSTPAAERAPARFQAKVIATETNNVWAAVLAPFTLVFAEMLPYVNLSVRVELQLQVGDKLFAASGVGDKNVSVAGPEPVAKALKAALGLALNDALNQVKAAR
jgi:hypothetical protein